MAYLNGIDVSSWQSGINIGAMPVDFAIVKATQGNSYINPDCARAVENARAAGKLFGVYHYIDGSGAIAEADYFIDNIANWVGKGILCLDWESNQNSQWGNESYLEQVAARVIERTGIRPLIYVQQSRMDAVAPIAGKLNCGLWIAQYADMSATGFQANPWNEGAYSCAIRQYSSTGRISGYDGNLDLNKFYGDANAWNAYATGGNGDAPTINPAPVPGVPVGTTLDLAAGVMRGEYGAGDARKQKLGSRYDEVQSFIDHIYSASAGELANEVWTGKYGNGDVRKQVLGSRYDEVMAVVNGSSGQSVATCTVQPGDTLSGIAAMFGTSYQHIADINGLSNPNLIYPGQVLKIY